MAEEGAFDEGADGLLLVGVELAYGFEVVGDVVGDGALSVVGHKHICAGVEGSAVLRMTSRVGWLVPAS